MLSYHIDTKDYVFVFRNGTEMEFYKVIL